MRSERGDVLGVVGQVHRTLFLGGHELDGERLMIGTSAMYEYAATAMGPI